MIEWVTVNGFIAMLDIVARASGRVFVGLPLCKLITAFTRVNF